MKSVQQKYDEAAQRNLSNFLHKDGHKRFTASVDRGRRQATMHDLKHHLGIRQNDSRFDTELKPFVKVEKK